MAAGAKPRAAPSPSLRGGSDVIARTVAEKMSKTLGQQIVSRIGAAPAAASPRQGTACEIAGIPPISKGRQFKCGPPSPPKLHRVPVACLLRIILRSDGAVPRRRLTTQVVPQVVGLRGIAPMRTVTIQGKIGDLRELGFVDPVKMIETNPSILNYAIANIRGKIADLRELGFVDPVKMITSNPLILGYARDRLLLCGRIIMRLQDDQTDEMFCWLIKKPRALIDAVEAAQPQTWSEVRTIVAAAKNKAKP
jgi:hypothetical protein